MAVDAVVFKLIIYRALSFLVKRHKGYYMRKEDNPISKTYSL